MSEIVYRAGEVWLCRYDGRFTALEIVEIANGFVCYRSGSYKRWCAAADWHSMAQAKLGVVRRILGIRMGIKR